MQLQTRSQDRPPLKRQAACWQLRLARLPRPHQPRARAHPPRHNSRRPFLKFTQTSFVHHFCEGGEAQRRQHTKAVCPARKYLGKRSGNTPKLFDEHPSEHIGGLFARRSPTSTKSGQTLATFEPMFANSGVSWARTPPSLARLGRHRRLASELIEHILRGLCFRVSSGDFRSVCPQPGAKNNLLGVLEYVFAASDALLGSTFRPTHLRLLLAKFGKCWPDWPDLARIGGQLTKSGKSLATVCRKRPNLLKLGPNAANIGQFLARVGRDRLPTSEDYP